MSGRPANGLTRGGPMRNKRISERIAEQEAENKYTGINSDAAAALEQKDNDNGYFSWKLSQRQTPEQRQNPAKYEAEFRQRYANYLAKRGGTRRRHRRKNKKTQKRR